MICNLFPGLRDKPMATTNFLLAVIAGELFVLIAFLVARFHA